MDFSLAGSAIFEASNRRWRRHGLSERLWRGEAALWSADVATPDLADRLGWLRLHDTMAAQIPAIEELVSGVVSDGVTDVVLCGMGGSSLAPEVFSATFGSASGHPVLHLLDSTHPEAVASMRDSIDPASAIFVVSSKSGSTLETISLFRSFWEMAGGDGSRFVAITDPGSSLDVLGVERGFRAVIRAFPDIGGRFSALSHFGLVPAALLGVEISRLLDSAKSVAEGERSSAVELGLVWGSLVLDGRDKLHVHTSPSLSAFPAWLEQLVAESLGKEGTGLLPIAGGSSSSAFDRSHIRYRLAGESLEAESGPCIEMPDRYAIGGEMLRAEVATAVAGEVLGVNPFDQPNVEAAKVLAKKAMADGGGAEDGERGGLEDLQRLLDSMEDGDYIGIQAYLPPSSELEDGLESLREAFESRTGASVSLGWGPRFLHSTGQFHKGGPNSGVFVQLVDTPRGDLAVPETDHTFGQIIAAQARGDLAALQDAGRRALSLSLGADRVAGLAAILEGMW